MASAQLEIAIRAALNAGKIISRESNRLDQIQVQEKAMFDFVSEVDLAAENSICETLHQYFPKDSIFTEETGDKFKIECEDCPYTEGQLLPLFKMILD